MSLFLLAKVGHHCAGEALAVEMLNSSRWLMLVAKILGTSPPGITTGGHHHA